MEWQLAGLYWGALSSTYIPPPQCCSPPTELDLFLIQLAYEVAAAASPCPTCGAPLSTKIHIVTHHNGQLHGVHVSIATRCRGLRNTAIPPRRHNNTHRPAPRPARTPRRIRVAKVRVLRGH